MCYYSKTLHPSQFRAAKQEGEDLVVRSDGHGHNFAASPNDGKIVCLLPGTQVHIEKLELVGRYRASLIREARTYNVNLLDYEGKPFSGVFHEVNGGYSADRISIRNGYSVHLVYLKAGTKFYTGAKRLDVAEKLGIDDPSIALDHRTDVAPTHGGIMRKIVDALTIKV